ncbi:MAG TPA: hypothetical protein VMM15_15115, partial [Bradyrhizobium sp.]|nr:hypothetical protein [Bradyrhizobium sp.]
MWPAATHVSAFSRHDREMPLCIEAGCPNKPSNPEKRKQNIFFERDWTVDSMLNPQANFDFSRTR